MKLFLSILIFFVSSIQSFGQKDSSLFLVEDAMRSRRGIDKIVYIDSSISFWRPFNQLVKKGKAEGFKGISKVTLQFSPKEIRYLDKVFRKQKAVQWPNNLFSNCIRINEDSLLLLSKDTSSRNHFKRNFGEKYFYFCQPVLIRNGTMAIFRLAEMLEPSAGYDLVYFYIKKQGKWEQFMFIHAGSW